MSVMHYWFEHTIKPRCHSKAKESHITPEVGEVTCVACLHIMVEERDAMIKELYACLMISS